MSSTFPSQGIRLTCTSRMLRKILRRIPCSLRNRGSYSCSIAITRPSPGATTTSEPSGTCRLGFRKNQAVNSAIAPNTIAGTAQPSAPAITAGPPVAAMNGSPSRTIGIPTALSAIRSFFIRSRRTTHSVLAFIHELVLLEPGHHRPKSRPNLFDRMRLTLRQQGIVDRPIGLVFQHPLAGKSSTLDLLQNFPHLLFGLIRDDPRPPRHVTVLGGGADRVTHIGDPAFVDQIHDQFDLVQTLKVGHLGRIAGIDKRFISGLNEGREASAQHHLFTEQIGLGFLPE